MNEVIRPYLDNFCLFYLKDILIYSRDEIEHLQHILLVLEKLRGHRLYEKMSKRKFLLSSTLYLAHSISLAWTGVEERKIWAVSSLERTNNLVNLQSFLGLCNYYRKFVWAKGDSRQQSGS
jgi:hypothetical protein